MKVGDLVQRNYPYKEDDGVVGIIIKRERWGHANVMFILFTDRSRVETAVIKHLKLVSYASR